MPSEPMTDAMKLAVEALEPFVRHGRAIGALNGGIGPFWIMDDTGHRDIPAADFVKARAALTALQEAMADGENAHPQDHWTTRAAVSSARELIKAGNSLCFAGETACGTAGRDEALCTAIDHWAAERDKHKQVLRIIELEGHSPEIGAGLRTPSHREKRNER